MQPTAILLPAIVQALLAMTVLVLLGPARARSMREHGQSFGDEDVRLGRNAWSAAATQVGNNYRNQFELPVLFFAVVAFALIAGAVDTWMVGLAWAFALSRIAHAAVHIGPNILRWRGLTFGVGFLALLAMWLKLFAHLL